MITQLFLAANAIGNSGSRHLQLVALQDGLLVETEVQSSGTNLVVSAPDKISSHSTNECWV